MIDSSSKIKHGTKGDASVLSPTVMTSVPLILDRIYKGINDKVSKKGGFSKALFEFACQYKSKWVRRGFDTPLINRYGDSHLALIFIPTLYFFFFSHPISFCIVCFSFVIGLSSNQLGQFLEAV